MKKFLAAAAALAAVVAWSQTVDQGRPGKQGPWPVSLSSTAVDGGPDFVQMGLCASAASDGGLVHQNTVTGVAAVTTPANQNAGRVYVVLCNSLQNSGQPLVKCRVDGTTPVMAATNAGDVLGVGDCAQYAIGPTVVPQCISDTAATNVTSYECVSTP